MTKDNTGGGSFTLGQGGKLSQSFSSAASGKSAGSSAQSTQAPAAQAQTKATTQPPKLTLDMKGKLGDQARMAGAAEAMRERAAAGQASARPAAQSYALGQGGKLGKTFNNAAQGNAPQAPAAKAAENGGRGDGGNGGDRGAATAAPGGPPPPGEGLTAKFNRASRDGMGR